METDHVNEMGEARFFLEQIRTVIGDLSAPWPVGHIASGQATTDRARQWLVEREEVMAHAMALGMTSDAFEDYDERLLAYAKTVIGNNYRIWRQGWDIALHNLRGGERLPDLIPHQYANSRVFAPL